MINLTYEIKAEKQPNGIFGTPLNCTYIQQVIPMTHEQSLLHSAIVIGIGEKYHDKKFRIYHQTLEGFIAIIGTEEQIFKGIKYADYKLEGNILHWIG